MRGCGSGSIQPDMQLLKNFGIHRAIGEDNGTVRRRKYHSILKSSREGWRSQRNTPAIACGSSRSSASIGGSSLPSD
eukprot:876917-Amorphochlora_amoeboformis.AAC.1